MRAALRVPTGVDMGVLFLSCPFVYARLATSGEVDYSLSYCDTY